MTDQDLKTYAAEIETTLVIAFFPSFLNYVVSEGYIHFVISSHRFEGLSVAERTSLVFSKLKLHDPEILEKALVVVEAFTTDEVEDLIDFYF